jgi:hypothetical protein
MYNLFYSKKYQFYLRNIILKRHEKQVFNEPISYVKK